MFINNSWVNQQSKLVAQPKITQSRNCFGGKNSPKQLIHTLQIHKSVHLLLHLLHISKQTWSENRAPISRSYGGDKSADQFPFKSAISGNRLPPWPRWSLRISLSGGGRRIYWTPSWWNMSLGTLKNFSGSMSFGAKVSWLRCFFNIL